MPDTETTHASPDSTGHAEGETHHHAPTGAQLGPVDVAAWAYAGAGSLLGLLTVLALYVARGA